MTTPALVQEVKHMVKKDRNWLEKMTSPQLEILARLNPDICEIRIEKPDGSKVTIVKPEYRHRYRLYAALRKARRCPKNQHGEQIVKTMKE